MNIVQKNVNDLIPYAKNTKKHDRKQIANVAESIKQYGFVQPVVIDRDGVIVIGHCRVLGAKKTRNERSSVRLRGRPYTGTGERIANRG